jgi:ribonuclease HII
MRQAGAVMPDRYLRRRSFCPRGFSIPLLNDSKQVTEDNRNLLRVYIEANALAWAVARVDHDEIDRINILKASFKAMHLALDQLRVRPRLLLIDGNRFTKYKARPSPVHRQRRQPLRVYRRGQHPGQDLA